MLNLHFRIAIPTESHKNADSQGWNFDEMSLYTENGDLQGFYVTYTRPHPCNNK